VKSIGNIPACPAETLHSAVKEAGTDDHWSHPHQSHGIWEWDWSVYH
jgi:hypothetical protein